MKRALEDYIVQTLKVFPLICDNVPYTKDDKTYLGKGVICVLIPEALNWRKGSVGEAVILSGGNAGETISFTHEIGEAESLICGGLGCLYGLGSKLSVKIPGEENDYAFCQSIKVGKSIPKFITLSDKERFSDFSGVATVGEIKEWAEIENARYEKEAILRRDDFKDFHQSYEDMDALASGAWKLQLEI